MNRDCFRFRRSRAIFLFLLFVLASSRAPRGLEANEAANAKVAVDTLREHLDFLASDELAGRDSGDPGLEVAAEYIANRFREYGLEPAGDNGTFFQHFTVPGGAAFCRHDGASVVMAHGSELAWNAGTDVEAFGFDAPGAIEAPLVFAGYGITAGAGERSKGLEYDDYAGLDARGKVVVVLRFTPRWEAEENPFGGKESPHAPFLAKIENARRHGAAGIIFVTPPGSPEEDLYGLAHRAAPRQPSLPALVATRAALDRVLRAHGQTVSRLVASIGSDLVPRSFELEGTSIRFATTRRHLRLRNVAARLEGSDPALSAEVVLIGGHYDHIGRFGNQVAPKNLGRIHNGADDNASGTAGVLELARLFAQGKRPPRTLLFVLFSGEEIGLLGSRHWVEAPRHFVARSLTRALPAPPDPHGAASDRGGALVWETGTYLRATGRFSSGLVEVTALSGGSGWVQPDALEQVGGPDPVHRVAAMINLDMIGHGGNRVTVLGVESSAAFEEMLAATSRELEQPYASSRTVFGGSDHGPFLQKGIPYLFFFTGMHSRYNTPDDDVETLDVPAEARILELVRRTAEELASRPERPPFDPRALASATPHGRPQLGIFVDDEYRGSGVRVRGIVPNSPAAACGLAPGDIIVQLGDTKVTTLGDLHGALDGRPEGKVPLCVERGGVEENLEVEFPARQGRFRIRFGSVPDYGYAEKGVRFDAIRQDTPASRAGVLPGDVLVRWNGKEVLNVEQWTQLLREHEPGDGVEIEVRRGDETVRLRVELEGR